MFSLQWLSCLLHSTLFSFLSFLFPSPTLLVLPHFFFRLIVSFPSFQLLSFDVRKLTNVYFLRDFIATLNISFFLLLIPCSLIANLIKKIREFLLYCEYTGNDIENNYAKIALCIAITCTALFYYLLYIYFAEL